MQGVLVGAAVYIEEGAEPIDVRVTAEEKTYWASRTRKSVSGSARASTSAPSRVAPLQAGQGRAR
ncbi:MAG: hypothetical protein A2V77_24335 [Anaeromyxobacter sp. RBG_16_69_14]|nr:MAG: hypothetical protein A2V77_24335 [Anaeromyxobacter sp. RBG_16_69_14]